MNTLNLLIDTILESAVLPDEKYRPKRARAIIFDQLGKQFIGMARTKPGRDPYISFPGGHLESSDKTPLDAVKRELEEELTNVHPENVNYSEKILRYEDEFFFIGILNEPNVELILGGPEKEGDAELYGTYDPKWLLVEYIPKLNVLPKEISTIISNAFAKLDSASR
jgi:8-oxo-dGTP pyrophosphatase MutT (NUDIX family)